MVRMHIAHLLWVHREKAMVTLFFAVVLALIVQVLLNVKDVSDGWILDGLLWHFVLLTLAYSLIVAFSRNIKLIAVITAVYLTALNLIPNLKYVFIYGYHDPLYHYGSIRATTMLGHVSGVGSYASQYEGTPGMHIFVSVLSVATGMNTTVAMKTFLAFAPFVIPLAMYLVMRRASFPSALAKATFASLAIISPVTYTFFGGSATYSLYVLFIYLFLLLALSNRVTRRQFAIVAVVGMAIFISHDITSFFLLVYLLSLLFVSRSPKKLKDWLSVDISKLLILAFAVTIFAHFTLSQSLSNFASILSLAEEALSRFLLGRGLVAFSQYEGFYTLNSMGKVAVFFARFGKDLVSLSLVSLAPLAYLKLRLPERLRKFYRSLVLPLSLAVVIYLGLLFLRPVVHREFYMYSFLPFLGGLAVFYLFCVISPKSKKAILCSSIVAFSALSLVTAYPLQPLIPIITTEGGTYYALDMRTVNTVFDRSLISFVSTYDYKLYVWADDIAVTQIYGLTNTSFHSLIVGNPNKANIMLVSHTERSHSIASGRGASNIDIYLLQSLQQNGVFYTNGFSYAFLNMSTITSRVR